MCMCMSYARVCVWILVDYLSLLFGTQTTQSLDPRPIAPTAQSTPVAIYSPPFHPRWCNNDLIRTSGICWRGSRIVVLWGHSPFLTGLFNGTGGTGTLPNGLVSTVLWSSGFDSDNFDSRPSVDNCCVTPNKPFSFTPIITQIISKKTKNDFFIDFSNHSVLKYCLSENNPLEYPFST